MGELQECQPSVRCKVLDRGPVQKGITECALAMGVVGPADVEQWAVIGFFDAASGLGNSQFLLVLRRGLPFMKVQQETRSRSWK